MSLRANVNPRETEKFGQLGARWWDPNGPMHSLHAINPLRTRFITEALDIRDRRLLDVGCGAGLLAESLAHLGARVTGIDASEDVLELAKAHADEQGLDIEYRYMSAEQLADQQPGAFDVVVCMEVLEHIPAPGRVVSACSQLLRTGGYAFFSTLDRTPKSFFFGIVGAEYILRLLPVGSHTYRNLIRPDELISWAKASNLEFVSTAGIAYDLLTRKFSMVRHHEVSYMMHFTKM